VLNRLFSRSGTAAQAPPAEPAVVPPPAEVPPRPAAQAEVASPAGWSFPFRARSPKSRLPVYVMLPLDTVTRDGVLTNAKALAVGFQARSARGLRRGGAHAAHASRGRNGLAGAARATLAG
jgi:hypothetical protein